MTAINNGRITYEMTRRNLTAGQLARLANLSEASLSRARHGRACRPATLRALAAALDSTPIDPAIDRLLTVPA